MSTISSTSITPNPNPNPAPKAPKVTFTDPNANSFSDKLLRWEMLQSKLAEKLASMPYVQPLFNELTQLIAEAKSHEFALKAAKAAARQAVADRKAMMNKGEGIRSRLAGALSFEHGSTSAILAEFGLRPRKAGGRKKNAGPPPSPPPSGPEIQVHPGPQVAGPVTEAGAKASTQGAGVE